MPDENDLTILHALIIGPADTPYEGGIFEIFIRYPPTYPFDPPLVKNLTTSGGRVRFNPNFYKNGKICLSILGLHLKNY
jgi:ubiquitin-conjugating enzyme E2 Z